MNTIEDIYKSIDKIVLKHLMINDEAMKICQSLGYNGFKRLHRVNSKKLLDEHIKLENDMFDKYRKLLNVVPDVVTYNPVNLKMHINEWKKILDEDIDVLGQLNFNHIQLIGLSNDVIECLIKIFIHDYKKVCRYYQRFSESNWNSIDMHLVDDKLHKKYKDYEE